MTPIIERAEHPTWTSNAYLVADRAGGTCALVDGHGHVQRLLDRIEADGLEVAMILLTHDHSDHVDIGAYKRFKRPVYAHPITADALPGGVVSDTIDEGDRLLIGAELAVEPLFTPGHAAGHLAFRIGSGDCITGDTLFKGTVAGNKGPTGDTIDVLKRSVMRLAELPPETRLHPGHTLPTTSGDEYETNPFIRIWRGLDEPDSTPVSVRGQEATLLYWGLDYDGSNKALVRFASGEEAVVGGSAVQR
jgi:hydroxyacylglutathione hydrolase